MMPRRTIVSVTMVVLFAAVCLGGLGLIALNMGLRGPWSNEFALSADFTSANGLVPQAEVRVSGVHVGMVTAISDSKEGDALVQMALQPGIQLRQDTRAIIRPKTLLGEKFVELVRKQSRSTTSSTRWTRRPERRCPSLSVSWASRWRAGSRTSPPRCRPSTAP